MFHFGEATRLAGLGKLKGINKREQKLKKHLNEKIQDARMTDPRDGDIIIPVMGATGAGKSTVVVFFINSVVGGEVMKVGHDLKSCTRELGHVVLPYQNPAFPNGFPHRVILLDTPGFDDTELEDVEILRRISVWLALSYNEKMKVAGLVYIHDITQARFPGSVMNNYDLFRNICGNEAAPRVVLVSSKWSEVAPHVGERRQRQLESDFWGSMLSLGASVGRFDDADSAHAIVQKILSSFWTRKLGADHVQLQDELVRIGRLLPETDAGKCLRLQLDVAIQRLRIRIQRNEDLFALGAPASETLLKEYKEDLEKLESLLRQAQEMKIPVSRQILIFFRLISA